MKIYIDNGDTVKIYHTKVKVAKAIETLLELDGNLVWSETHKGYGVAIIDKAESECVRDEMSVSDKSNS